MQSKTVICKNCHTPMTHNAQKRAFLNLRPIDNFYFCPFCDSMYYERILHNKILFSQWTIKGETIYVI